MQLKIEHKQKPFKTYVWILNVSGPMCIGSAPLKEGALEREIIHAQSLIVIFIVHTTSTARDSDEKELAQG